MITGEDERVQEARQPLQGRENNGLDIGGGKTVLEPISTTKWLLSPTSQAHDLVKA